MSLLKIIHLTVISICLFSLWAAFALLIVNPIFNADLPGYRLGRICIWEYVAMSIAILCSFAIVRLWGYPEIVKIGNHKRISFNIHYVYFYLSYFIVAIAIAIWQFWIFSQKF